MAESAGREGETVLAADFPPVDRAEWTALAGDVDALTRHTYDGIAIAPLYDAGDAVAPDHIGWPGAPPFVRGGGAAGEGWEVRQRVSDSTGDAVAELERGSTSLLVDLRDAPTIDVDVLDEVLDGVLLDAAAVVLDAGSRWADAATALTALWDRRGVDPVACTGGIGADPVGAWLSDRTGVDVEAGLATLATWADRLAVAPTVRVVSIDGTRFHNAGASDAQELGFALSALVPAWRALADDGGLGAAAALGRCELRLAATVDQFATIAKFRAARRLLTRLAEAAGAADAAGDVPLHAVTSRAMTTGYDPAVNMLRATVACFAAGIGGADAITVRPYDELVTDGAATLGRRLARNTQSVLAMEAHLTRVVDPAGGSWYVERRTDDLAEAAWDCFQLVEQAGGIRAAAESGVVDTAIAATRTARDDDVDRRRAPLTGLTEFPDAGGSAPANLEAAGFPADGSLPRLRWGAHFETLRARVDAVAASGSRPRAHLTTLGTAAEHATRLAFARNLFAIAGLDTPSGPPETFVGSGATVACLCGPDEAYATSAVETARALTLDGATCVFIAGRPRDGADALAAEGVVAVHAGCDARAVLTALLDHLGVP